LKQAVKQFRLRHGHDGELPHLKQRRGTAQRVSGVNHGDAALTQCAFGGQKAGGIRFAAR